MPEWSGCGDGCHSLCREAAEGGGPHVAGGQKAERGKGAHSRAGSIFRDVMDEGRRHSCTAHWRNLEKRQATSARSILMSARSGLQVKSCNLFSPLRSSRRSLRLYCSSLGRACTHNGSAPPRTALLVKATAVDRPHSYHSVLVPRAPRTARAHKFTYLFMQNEYRCYNSETPILIT